MDRTLLFGAAVALSCVRDARLIATRRRLAAVLSPVALAAAAGCGLVAERLSAADADRWMGDSRFWLPAVLLHATLSLHAARKSRLEGPAGLISVLPTPVWCVAMTGAARIALVRIDGAMGLSTGLALGAAYLVATALIAVLGRARANPRTALRFAAATQISAILLVPAATVLDRSIEGQPVDWLVSGVVISLVALIMALSFAWHRRR